MEKFAAVLISGAVSGAVFSLLSAGLVLTYQSTRVFNFAQGSVSFCIALLYYELTSGLHWPQAPAAILSILVVAPLLGLVADALVLRSLSHAEESAKIVATVGLLVALPALALWITRTAINTFGVSIPAGDNILFPGGLGPIPKDTWAPFTWLRIDSNQLIVIILAAACAVGLWWLTQRTRFGLRMRATVDRRPLAEYRGVDTARMSRVVWMLSFALAGLVGVAGAPFFALTPLAFTGVLVVAATAAVFGGLRSLPYAFVGGLLIGIIQSLFSGYAGFADDITGLSTALPYILLFVALLVRSRAPARLTGQAAETRATADHLAGLPAWRRRLPWCVVTIVLLACVLFFANSFWTGLLQQGFAYALIFLSFVIVAGIGGMVSLAQTAFVMQASLLTGLVLSDGWPWLPALAVGVGSSIVLGIIVALPALRLDGLALALATLALALIGDTVLFVWKPLSNAEQGWTITRPVLFGLDFNNDRSYAVLLLGVFGVAAALVANLRRSATGRAVLAVRSAPAAAASVGLLSVRSKLAVFALSAAVAGLGGVMLATANRSISDLSINALMGLTWLAIVVIFGLRRIGGALLAGILFALMPQLLSYVTTSTQIPDILFGLGAITYAKAPDGMLAQIGEFTQRVRRLGVGRRPQAGGGSASPAGARPAVASSADVLTVTGLHAGYGEVEVVHGVDLRLAAGRLTVLLGSNGAGKSTLCNALAGGLPTTSGAVFVGRTNVTALSAHARSERGLIFAPESRGIFPGLTVADNLALTLKTDDDREAALARFPSLRGRQHVAAGLLSGGEQQMLTLAPIVIHRPMILIVDEPTLGLAPLIVDEILEIFVELRNAGTAILLVEEKARHVLDIADDIAFLERGRIAWTSAAGEVDVDRLAASYLQIGAATSFRQAAAAIGLDQGGAS